MAAGSHIEFQIGLKMWYAVTKHNLRDKGDHVHIKIPPGEEF